jgi:hypothetical protein
VFDVKNESDHNVQLQLTSCLEQALRKVTLLDGWMIGIAGTQRRRRISIERCRC